MTDPHNLDRFVSAQASVISAVMAELRAGQKRSHWMWFVFPQIAGLGFSATAQHYALASRAEADAYLAHPVLGPRLQDCTATVNRHKDRTVHAIFGSPDDLKFRSSMTLFAAVAGDGSVFDAALQLFFGGAADARTLDLLRPAGTGSHPFR